MSQKPKAGASARPASPTKVAAKEVVAKAASGKAEPIAESEPVEVEAAPVLQNEPIVAEEPAMEVAPAVNIAETTADTPDPAADTPEPVEEAIAAVSDLAAASAKVVSQTMTATADTVAAVTAEVVETAASIKPTRPNLTQGIKTMMKSTEDFVAFSQANLEAFVKSGQIWSAGVQELTKQFATSAKASFEESVSTFKAISTAKSVKEAMDLQSSFAKAALEKAMAESNKLTDASIKLTEQTLAPITARVTVAVETFGKTA